MEVIVIEEHISHYPNPLDLKAGEQLKLGRIDDEYPNWIFATTQSGVKGWVPVQYVERVKQSSVGLLTQDYDAYELNTILNEKLQVLFELNSWYRVSRSNGEIGWIPVHSVQEV
ncbi:MULTISPECIES: SH3 domain-containing protein [unclassified Vibrio]|uniref:SH3 domain-containing protein n=1 Tax=Vibrio sp. HB236076 TaxID=3232307 RepID=A0AB39HBE1_9VIBR|nr:SH3 domain-containing protein [Vibrio sp. HB161653]MDP5253452.1 SH3 domain-containing protein [Vibrio sp. HB161653]